MMQWNYYSDWETLVKWQWLSIFESPVIHSVQCPHGLEEDSTRAAFHAVDSGFFVHETWIPDTNRQWIPDSLSCIPDSKAHDSWFYKQKFRGYRISQAKSLGFRNPYSLTWVE